jgi:hypothetical protein
MRPAISPTHSSPRGPSRISRLMASRGMSSLLRRGRSFALWAALVAGAAPAFAQATTKDTARDTAKADPLCATYGADFQRVPGTTSCVRSGAAVRTDVYGGRTPGNAPNQFSGTPTGSTAPTASDAPAADPWKAAR